MALFLRRREGESIVIGDGTLVTVCRNRYGQFGLLTSAPSGVRVDRLEVYHARGNVDQPHWHDIEQPGDSQSPYRVAREFLDKVARAALFQPKES